jgi:hypothetical protein
VTTRVEVIRGEGSGVGPPGIEQIGVVDRCAVRRHDGLEFSGGLEQVGMLVVNHGASIREDRRDVRFGFVSVSGVYASRLIKSS